MTPISIFISKKVAEETVVFSEGAEGNKKGDAQHPKEIFQPFSMRAKQVTSAIIICCPNAGYYECMHYEV